MSTRGVPFHVLPNHAQHANRPSLVQGAGMVSSTRYAYNASPIAVNKFAPKNSGKVVAETILIASRSGASPGDTNPYMMPL